jgi:hypothetical protein
MRRVLGTAALVAAVCAQNSSLPTVDLGYEIYRASSYNVRDNPDAKLLC